MPRPKIEVPYSQVEKLLQILSFLAFVGLIGLTVVSMIRLPAKIPTHFGIDGQPDGWGGKGSLLMLPIMDAVLYIPITILEKYPWIYNYTVAITEKNAAYQYKLGRQLLEWVNFIVVMSFCYLQWQKFQAAVKSSVGLGNWFLPIFLTILFGVIGFGIYKMVRHR